nr:hypothetical protein [Tanacetum cinerariifolium]
GGRIARWRLVTGVCVVWLEMEQQGDDVASWWPWNVFECTFPTEMMRSIISMVSISLEGFLPSILLLVVIIVMVFLVVVVIDAIVRVVIVVASIRVVVVVMIIGIVILDGGVSHIIKLSFVIIGFLYRFVLQYLVH